MSHKWAHTTISNAMYTCKDVDKLRTLLQPSRGDRSPPHHQIRSLPHHPTITGKTHQPTNLHLPLVPTDYTQISAQELWIRKKSEEEDSPGSNDECHTHVDGQSRVCDRCASTTGIFDIFTPGHEKGLQELAAKLCVCVCVSEGRDSCESHDVSCRCLTH